MSAKEQNKPEATPQSEAPTGSENPQKKKRGRPRKNPIEAKPTAKKKRGRPRKNAIAQKNKIEIKRENGSDVSTKSDKQTAKTKTTSPSNDDKKIKVGIITSKNYRLDIKSFNEKGIFKYLVDNGCELTFFGYNCVWDKEKIVTGIDFNYEKPAPLHRYWKKLAEFKFDLVFVPLRDNTFNFTSEDYKKYLDVGILKIPILAPYFSLYNKVISDGETGYLYKEKTIKQDIDRAIKDPNRVAVGVAAYTDIKERWSYNDNSTRFVKGIFGEHD